MCEAYATGREVPPHPDAAATAALTGGDSSSKEDSPWDRWQMRHGILPRWLFLENNKPLKIRAFIYSRLFYFYFIVSMW
jgi:hypothetical protein